MKETVMDEKQDADTASAKAKQGVKESTSSENDGVTKTQSGRLTHRDYSDPLFLKNNPEGQKGNPQDEKDESAE
jgi:hypothetical protein